MHLDVQYVFCLSHKRLWQNVTSAILDRDQVRATQEKFVLEEAQRNEAKERGDKPWAPRLFQQDPVTSEWSYKHIEYEHAFSKLETSIKSLTNMYFCHTVQHETMGQ